MSDFCQFCGNYAVINPKITKKLYTITPVTPSEYWNLMNSDMAHFPRYVNTDPGTPPDYGKPYSGMLEAQTVFTATLPVLLAGVAAKVSKKVVPIWYLFMNGGVSGVIDLAKFDPSFVKDFQDDPSTKRAVKRIKQDAEAYFRSHPSELPAATAGPKEFDLASIIPQLLAAFADYQSNDQLNFNTIGSVPGNLIGGFGPPNDQTNNLFGHTPSQQNDSRKVGGKVTVSPNVPPGGFQPPQTAVRQFTFNYVIDFDVKDTIDFCPGNFGSKRVDDPDSFWAEEDLTVPLSRLEASRVVGDVPVQIQYRVQESEVLSINA